MRSIGLIITAGGTGSRFSPTQDKLFVALKGEPLLAHTLRAFSGCHQLTHIVMTCHPRNKARMEALAQQANLTVPWTLVEGGDTRKASVQAGLSALKHSEIVMIHDGARPCVSSSLIHTLMHHAQTHDAVIPGCAMVETIKRVHQGIVETTLPRDHVFGIQTPQLFRRESLEKAYEHGHAIEATDEAMLMEALGIPVHVIDGERSNIKVTHLEDLPHAEIYLQSQHEADTL